MRKRLQSSIPDPDDLLGRESPDMAKALLTSLLSLNEGELHLHNLTQEGFFSGGYPSERHDEINRAIAGAWSWLLAQGYLGPRPGSSDSSWVAITPQGQRWYENVDKAQPTSSVTRADDGFELEAVNIGVRELGFTDYFGLPLDEQTAVFLGQLLVWENSRERDFDFTYSSILSIFLLARDPLSTWLRQYMKTKEIFTDSIISRAKIDQKTRAEAADKSVNASSVENALRSRQQQRPTWSQSAKAILQAASELTERVGQGRTLMVGVRHLLAAFIYKQSGHEDDLREWGINAEDWGSAFIRWLGNDFRIELDAWIILHSEFFKRGQILSNSRRASFSQILKSILRFNLPSPAKLF